MLLASYPRGLALIRWEKPERGFRIQEDWEGQKNVRLELKELVLMTREEAIVHESEVLIKGKKVEEIYEDDVIKLVERRKKEEEGYERYR